MLGAGAVSNIKALDRLVAQFTKLPGVGAKTAQRFAYRVINMSEAEAEEFASASDMLITR